MNDASRCDHKFVDSKHCLKCGIGFAELKAESLRESRLLNEPPPLLRDDVPIPSGWEVIEMPGGGVAFRRAGSGYRYVTLDIIESLLATCGRHVVSDLDKAALDALDGIEPATFRSWLVRGFKTVEALAKAALARKGETP